MNLINLKNFSDNPIIFNENYKNYKIKKTKIGPQTFHIISCPNIASTILLKYKKNIVHNKKIYKELIPITGEKGIVQLKNEDSIYTRNIFNKLFTSKDFIENYQNTIRKNTEEIISLIHQKKMYTDFNCVSVLFNLILKNAYQTFLGIKKINNYDLLVNSFLELNKLCSQKMLSIITPPIFFPTKNNLKIKKLRNIIREILKDNLEHSIFLKKLNGDFNNNSLIDHFLTLLFAGHETVASSLSFSLLSLGQLKKEVQDKINNNETRISFYNEALRMFPPAYMLVRSVEIKIDEYHINKNDQIIISLTNIFRNPKYFNNSNTFQFDRFLNNPIDQKIFFPFGLGPKACIGKELTYIEANIILELFIKNFYILNNNLKIESIPLVTLHPNSNQKISLIPKENNFELQ